MIIEIFLVLIGVAILSIVYGEITKELTFNIVGFSIFFILSGWVVFGNFTNKDLEGLQFKSGYTINTSDPSFTVVNYTYVSYNDSTTFWIGLFLTILGSLGWILSGISVKVDRGR